MDVLFPLEKLAVNGYLEVLRHYRELVGIRRSLRNRFIAEPPDLFITSPKVRSTQTAEIVAKAMRNRVKVVVDDRLGGPLEPAMLNAILDDAGPAYRPCLVGHDPDFSELLGELIGTSAIPMRKAALARIDFPGDDVDAGKGTLRYLLPPELVPG